MWSQDVQLANRIITASSVRHDRLPGSLLVRGLPKRLVDMERIAARTKCRQMSTILAGHMEDKHTVNFCSFHLNSVLDSRATRTKDRRNYTHHQMQEPCDERFRYTATVRYLYWIEEISRISGKWRTPIIAISSLVPSHYKLDFNLVKIFTKLIHTTGSRL